jgi:putative membrane protein
MFDGLDISWSFEPVVVSTLAGYLVIYTLRWRRSRAQGGARAAPVGRLVLWWTGIAALLVALVSPVGALGEQLASAHMVQHLLIADVAAICLTLALTRHILRPVTRHIHRLEQRAGPLAHPAFGALAYIGVMVFWHIPPFYDAAVESDAVHTAEHLSFAAAGLLYWWHLLSPIRSRLRLRGLAPVAYMAGTKIAVGFIGIALAFSPELIYTAYGFTDTRLGMTALDDQNVAGLIMALEQSIVMGVALAWLFVRMLAESDREDERAERFQRAYPTDSVRR